VCVYACVCMCMHVYACVCMCMHVCVCVSMRACACVCDDWNDLSVILDAGVGEVKEEGQG